MAEALFKKFDVLFEICHQLIFRDVLEVLIPDQVVHDPQALQNIENVVRDLMLIHRTPL